MALQWISAGWKTALKTAHPVADRVYIDFRQIDYPAITDTLTYTALTALTQWSGYSNATGGYAQYILDMPTKFVLDIRAKATFAFDTASDQPLASWYVGANTYLTILYRAADDKIVAKWKGSANERELASAALDGATLPAVTRITLSFDSTTGDTTGSALYLDEVLADDVWSGNIDSRSIRLPTFEIRAESGTAGDWKVNTVRFFSGITATATQVANHFSSVKDEEVFWYLNSCSLGQTRCNVTSYVRSAYTNRNVEDPDTGSPVGNQFSATLYSRSGEFADDQYAAFAPASGVYNGTSAQAYMKQRCRVLMETWYGDDFEPVFIGRVDGGFQRSTPIGDISMVNIGAVDQTADLAMRRLRKGRFYQSKDLASATEADSLVHLITRLGTEREVYNYLANSSFENATIANSWTASGGTLTREATPLIGSNGGQLANASGSEQTVTQIVTFTGTKVINVGEKWTFSIYLKSAGAAANDIRLEERDSGGTNGTSTAAYNLSGGEGWVKYEVSRTLTDTDSDRLAVVVEVANGVTLVMDCAMLTQSSRSYEWFVLNNNDGSSGTESADDADYDTYDTHGFDVDVVSITHPWVRLTAGDSPWEAIKALSVACIGYQIGFREEGVFAFKAVLGDAYSDPAADETIDAVRNVTATPVSERANKIVVRGEYIVVSTTLDTLWMAGQSGVFATDEVGRVSETVNNGSTWPPPATYGEFVARWDDEVDGSMGGIVAPGAYGTGVTRGGGAGSGGFGTPRSGTAAGFEIIGATDCAVKQMLETGAKLTVTTLNTSKYADGAVLLLTNGTGSAQVIKDIGIIGKAVYRNSGRGGFVHDSFTDWERVEREGEHVLEIANPFIIDKTQVEEIADWHWKYNSGSVKHIYTFDQAGTWHWLVPGRTYTLDIGGAGEKEYISATARLMSIDTERGAGDLGRTRLVFRELLQSWTFDSNAVARFLAGQDYNRLRPQREVVVAADTYVGRADYYCDGIADQTEINAAITAMNALGGGTVRLTEGTFYVSEAIAMKSDCQLSGGPGTTIEKNCNDYAVKAVGTSGTHLENIGIYALVITKNDADTNSKSLIYVDYVDGYTIERNVMVDGGYSGIYVLRASFGIIMGNTVSGNCKYGIIASYNTGQSVTLIANNICRDMSCGDGSGVYGLYLLTDNLLVSGNLISNCAGNNSSPASIAGSGIFLSDPVSNGFGVTVRGNQIDNCSDGRSSGRAIDNNAPKAVIEGNNCQDNGNLIDRGYCEGSTSPSMFDETTSIKTGCTFARSTDFAHTGTYSYKMAKTAAPGTAARVDLCDSTAANDLHGIVVGTGHTLMGYVYIPSVNGPLASEVSIMQSDSTAGAWSSTEIFATTDYYDSWQAVEVTRTIGTTCAAGGFRPSLAIASAASSSEYVWWDDLRLRPDGAHNEYGQNFYNSATGLQESGNSWQSPFQV